MMAAIVDQDTKPAPTKLCHLQDALYKVPLTNLETDEGLASNYHYNLGLERAVLLINSLVLENQVKSSIPRRSRCCYFGKQPLYFHFWCARNQPQVIGGEAMQN